MWRLDEDGFGENDSFDPLHFVRSRPVADDEAELIEAICQAATPGPLIVDDRTEGGGALIATLPDGRNIVSAREPAAGPEDAREATVANAQLICEARCLLLRLLRDRQRWQCRERSLVDKIQALEDQLDQHSGTGDEEWTDKDHAPARPR
ncbi:MAG: hypothetical protein ACYTG0_02965 [Planctomycetota bacterium]|jgi:hypothetical protein